MTDVTHVDRASQAWLTDPTVFEVNRTPAHSSHKWYARDPQSGQWSDLKQSLDGEWRVEVVQAADTQPRRGTRDGRVVRRLLVRAYPGSGPPADGRSDEPQVRERPVSVGRPREPVGTEHPGKQSRRALPQEVHRLRPRGKRQAGRRIGVDHVPRHGHGDLRVGQRRVRRLWRGRLHAQ